MWQDYEPKAEEAQAQTAAEPEVAAAYVGHIFTKLRLRADEGVCVAALANMLT